MSDFDLTEAVDAAARVDLALRVGVEPHLRALIPTAWDDLSERVKLGWREDVLPLITAAAPFIAAQAWDEGFTRGWNAAQVRFNTNPEREVDASEVDVPNPYRGGE